MWYSKKYIDKLEDRLVRKITDRYLDINFKILETEKQLEELKDLLGIEKEDYIAEQDILLFGQSVGKEKVIRQRLVKKSKK